MPTPVAVVPTPAAPVAAKPVAPAPAATPPPAEEPLFEVKVAGQMRKFTRSEAEKRLSKSDFADQMMRQAREALKATAEDREKREALKAKIKEDKAARDAFLREHGIDPDEFSRDRLSERLREAEMTPEQREIAARDKRIAELERANKAAEEEKAQQRLTARAEQIQKRIVGVLDEAWERAGFERGADSFKAVYDVMREWNEIGLLPKGDEFSAAHADRIIEAARENIEGAFKSLETATLKGLKGKALYDRIPKAVRDELNRYQLELIRGGGHKTNGNGAPPPKPAAPAEQFISPAEALKKMRGIG